MDQSLIEQLWHLKSFVPNDDQKKAILYDGKMPLFISAAPGSGKTRVLLWRTVHLIVDKSISPDRIFLSTFTEKAAHQLKEGLKELLGMAENVTGEKYDLARMFIGTIHSNCHRILAHRAFMPDGSRKIMPSIMDELGQYMYVYRPDFWKGMLGSLGWIDSVDTNQAINRYLGAGMHKNSGSRHYAAVNLIRLFNRFSEELADAAQLKSSDMFLDKLYSAYRYYVSSLNSGRVPRTDLSIVQAEALRAVLLAPQGGNYFEHVIIDEYQDTNTVQERLVFALAKGTKNLCVVGDDDQALYRFRGAAVENFVDFPERCKKAYGVIPEQVSLHTNYRSLNPIVQVSQQFMGEIDWNAGNKSYRIPKTIQAARVAPTPAVFVTDEAHPNHVAPQIARFVKELKKNGKVSDYNQVAVLFSYLKNNDNVERLTNAFAAEGIQVYAPRAGCFLDIDESVAVFGLFGTILGMPAMQGHGHDLDSFRSWAHRCLSKADELINNDERLEEFVKIRQEEVAQSKKDHEKILAYCGGEKIDLQAQLELKHLRAMASLSGLSSGTSQKLSSGRLIDMVRNGASKATAGYVVNRVTSLDWGLLDLFYQLTMFGYFRSIIDRASKGEDEGPICNMGLLTQYISRYQEQRGRPIVSGRDLEDDRLQRHFFMSYLFAMYRLGESEFEDSEDPFPKGRVSFITIHQAKGLEFPVVILASLYRRDNGADIVEEIVRNELGRAGEPLDRITAFDNARLFYVALSRAKDLLILPRYSGRGQRKLEAFHTVLDAGLPHLDTVIWNNIEPAGVIGDDSIGQSYSYTSDYLMYKRCPRQYMLFRKYDFVPARSSVMLFGSLVHQTLEDLHNYLLAQRRSA